MSDNSYQLKDVAVESAIKNIIDLASIRLDQSFNITASPVKKSVIISIRKPYNREFVRVNSDSASVANVNMVHLKESNEHYIVNDSLRSTLDKHLVSKTLFLAVNKKKECFIWPIKLPCEDGYIDPWNKSARIAADAAMNGWVSLKSDHILREYVLIRATRIIGQPTWPNLSFEEIVNIAFKDKYVGSEDHPVIRNIRGQE